MTKTQYEHDFYAWSTEQAALLRAGKLAEADIENIAEEIDSMGRSEKRELVNRLTVLLPHLLKWQFQPTFRGNSWRLSIEEQRYRLEDHFNDNLSLRSKPDVAMRDAYRLALIEAERESGLARATFPPACPFPFEPVMASDFWPESEGERVTRWNGYPAPDPVAGADAPRPPAVAVKRPDTGPTKRRGYSQTDGRAIVSDAETAR